MLRLLRLGFSYSCASLSYFRGTFCLSLPPCSSLRRFWPLNPDNWPLCAYSSPRGWFVWFAWWPCEWFWDPEGVLTWLCPGTGPLDLGSIFASNSCTALYEGLVALNTDAFSLGDKSALQPAGEVMTRCTKSLSRWVPGGVLDRGALKELADIISVVMYGGGRATLRFKVEFCWFGYGKKYCR